MRDTFEELYQITEKWKELSKNQSDMIQTLLREKSELILENTNLREQVNKLKYPNETNL